MPPATKALDPDPFPATHPGYATLLHFGFISAVDFACSGWSNLRKLAGALTAHIARACCRHARDKPSMT